MNIQLLDPKTLVHYERNSKKHPTEQVEAIAMSIKSFGFDQPIVVDANLVIIKGHGRCLAAISLGMPEVPVVIRDDVSDNDARFLREVDNQIQSAEWDRENLASELNELRLAGRLEFTLFTEDKIPVLPQMNITVKAQPFDLTTQHTCNSCSYKW